jgi:pimeloyl-ACP methyl ester carboxylesterase
MNKMFIDVEDGEKVAVSHSEADSDRFLFVCHGFGGNKERQKEYVEPGLKHSFNVVRIDFRGNGESDGDFVDQDLTSRIEDVKAVISYFDPEIFVLFGTSFGGTVVFHAAPDLRPDAVVGKAPVTYKEVMSGFREVVDEKGSFEYIDGKPIDRRFFSDLDSYSFDEAAERIKCPVAIFHGRSDTTVRPENSVEACQELDVDVMLHFLRDEGHSFSNKGKEKLFDQLFGWLGLLDGF